MPISSYAIETFISDKITRVTRCGAADLAADFPKRADWLKSYALSAILNDAYNPDGKGLALLLIRRIESSIDAYDAGRAQLLELVSASGGRWLPYVRAIDHFEVSITQLYTSYKATVEHDTVRKAFAKTDGYENEVKRLNELYNSYRHGLVTTDQPMWITDDGFESSKAALSFVDYESMLRSFALLAHVAAEGNKSIFPPTPPDNLPGLGL